MKCSTSLARNVVHLTPYAGAILACGLAAPALAAGVPAGTPIENTATATYIIGGTEETIDSNTVIFTVDELLDVTVTSLDGGTVGLNADGAVLTFQIKNVGNGPEAYEIDVDAALTDDDFDPAVTLIAYDSNGNDIYDEGVDTVIPVGGTTPDLAPDEMLRVFIITDLANDPEDGDLANVQLTATAQTGSGVPGTVFAGEGVDGSDAVVGTTTAQDDDTGTLVAQVSAVTLDKTATIVDPFGGSEAVPGAVVTYTLTASVSGSSSVSGLQITDPIPANTTYQTGTLTLDTVTLTDVTGDDSGSASDGAGVAVDLGTVSGGTDHAVTFNVIINN